MQSSACHAMARQLAHGRALGGGGGAQPRGACKATRRARSWQGLSRLTAHAVMAQMHNIESVQGHPGECASRLRVQPEHSRVRMHAFASHGTNACAGRRSFYSYTGSDVYLGPSVVSETSSVHATRHPSQPQPPSPLPRSTCLPLSCQHGSSTRPAPLHRAWAGSWTGVGNRTAVRARPSWLCEASRPSVPWTHAAAPTTHHA